MTPHGLTAVTSEYILQAVVLLHSMLGPVVCEERATILVYNPDRQTPPTPTEVPIARSIKLGQPYQ